MTSTMKWAVAVMALGFTGCMKGPLTIHEVVQNDTSITVDSTQVPEEWIERSVWKRRIGKTHTVRVKPGHRVKVILVPESQSPPA